jgi:hypothetical protein
LLGEGMELFRLFLQSGGQLNGYLLNWTLNLSALQYTSLALGNGEESTAQDKWACSQGGWGR